MDGLAIGILMLEGIVFAAVVVAIIYLAFQKYEQSKAEDFEKRDN